MPTASSDIVTLLGRFPPPIDGQAIATRRVAELLDVERTVHRIDLSAGDRRLAESTVRLRPDRIVHSLRAAARLRDALPAAGPVLWTSISPSRLGHLRDRLTVLPAFSEGHHVYGVIHWGNFDRVFRDPVTRGSARRMVARLSGFVFNSDALAERCAPWVPASKRFIVRNTVNDDVLCAPEAIEAKLRGRTPERPLRLLYLSNLTPSKGHRDVLEAVRLLRADGVPVTARFAGRWESEADAAAFEAFRREHGLEEAVAYVGSVADRDEIRRLHLDADAFLLPTYYPTEAQPVSIVEALNAGTPVVTTRHASIPEMVLHEQGALFVPPRHPEAVADAIRRLRDVDWWGGQVRAARHRFDTLFHPDVVRRQWLAVLGSARST